MDFSYKFAKNFQLQDFKFRTVLFSAFRRKRQTSRSFRTSIRSSFGSSRYRHHLTSTSLSTSRAQVRVSRAIRTRYGNWIFYIWDSERILIMVSLLSTTNVKQYFTFESPLKLSFSPHQRYNYSQRGIDTKMESRSGTKWNFGNYENIRMCNLKHGSQFFWHSWAYNTNSLFSFGPQNVFYLN